MEDEVKKREEWLDWVSQDFDLYYDAVLRNYSECNAKWLKTPHAPNTPNKTVEMMILSVLQHIEFDLRLLKQKL